MLETRFLISATRLETADFRRVVSHFATAGWTPALRESERAFLRCAGLEEPLAADPASEDWPGRIASLPSRRSHLRRSIAAELFFRNGEIFYLITKPEGRAFWMPPSAAEDDIQPEVEVGLISSTLAGLGDRLSQFADDLRNACAAAIAEPIKFDWRKDMPHTPRLAAILAADEASAQPSLSHTRLGLVELEYGRMLAAPLLRQILKDLLRAGFAREQDLLFLSKADPELLHSALEEFKEVGLVELEYLLECKQDRRPLIRAKNRRQLESPELAAFICPVCRGPFTSENLVTVYSATESAREICAHSQWLRIWLTDQLTQLGVPLGCLLWRRPDNAEETEILAEFMGQLWLFSIKDGDFGADDSYALNYRRVRCRADRIVLITSGACGSEARRLLDEAIGDDHRRGAAGDGVVYIEGLDQANTRLEQALASAAFAYGQHRLKPIEEIAGFDLGGLLRLRFEVRERPSAVAHQPGLAQVPKLALSTGTGD